MKYVYLVQESFCNEIITHAAYDRLKSAEYRLKEFKRQHNSKVYFIRRITIGSFPIKEFIYEDS